MNSKLLNLLIKDSKRKNHHLYAPGKYWAAKSEKILFNLRKKGIDEFRGMHSGVGTSYTDSLIYDVRNEQSIKGRLAVQILKLPILRSIFQQQLYITSSYIKNYLENLDYVFNNNERVNFLLKKYKFLNTTKFGCMEKFKSNITGDEYSTQYLKMAHRIEILSKYFNFKKIVSFFEIGGGFGANIHFLLTNFKNIKKIIYIDIFPNIFVGTEYLRFFYGENIKDYTTTRNQKIIEFEDNDKLEIICIPPWEIKKINATIDHFHNACSFVEMDEEIVSNYIKYLKNFKVKEYSLITYLSKKNNILSTSELQKLIDKRLNFHQYDEVIEKFSRKLIFLTSE